MEVEMLSRLQFAGTIMFHYLFPPLSIGLGLQLFLTELAFVRTGNPAWEAAAHIQLVPPNFYISNWCHPTFTQRAYSPPSGGIACRLGNRCPAGAVTRGANRRNMYKAATYERVRLVSCDISNCKTLRLQERAVAKGYCTDAKPQHLKPPYRMLSLPSGRDATACHDALRPLPSLTENPHNLIGQSIS
jgi:hypothetical protein